MLEINCHGERCIIIRVLEAREIPVDEIDEREEHGQTGHIGIAIIVRAIDEQSSR